jgi:cyclohexyl-isocyanide hydratase
MKKALKEITIGRLTRFCLNLRRGGATELNMPSFTVGFVLFPDLTQLDLTGPLQVLARLPQSRTVVAAKSESPVPSDCGLSLLPTHSFANCPPFDLICVPGGVKGVIGAIGDRETVDFVRRQAASAKYITSVCTGAFVLGVAGLLPGERPRIGPTPNCCLSSVRNTRKQGSCGTEM